MTGPCDDVLGGRNLVTTGRSPRNVVPTRVVHTRKKRRAHATTRRHHGRGSTVQRPTVEEMPPKQRKIAIMGYRSVGKSSLSVQFVHSQFVDAYDPTIENTFVKTIRIENQEYDLELVDTAGQDEYSILPIQYSMDVHGYVLVYSITSPKSFEIIQIIYEKLLDMTGKVQIPVILIGNKNDLHTDRVISQDEGRRLAVSWKAVFLETSAKKSECVVDIFHTMLLEIEKANGNIQEKASRCSIL